MRKIIRNSLPVCCVLAAMITTPVLAAPQRNEQLQAAPAYVPDSARDAAIHDCSVEASKWSFSTWQSTQIITYGDCMTAHGQEP
ncbi:MAG TPA: hypothetical protein VH206_04285 [Xanthobacteraceae bacterium]|jgi:hypothetical protein|nr:hypothetical protein [Xanthobacteraceae bacterium]